MSKKNPLIARALGRPIEVPFDPINEGLPSTAPSDFIAGDPVVTESSPESRSDISTPEEEEALRELDAKLNAIQGTDAVVDAPRAEMFFVTMDGISPSTLENFVNSHIESRDSERTLNVMSFVGAQALYIELTTFGRQLVVVLNTDPRVPLSKEYDTTFLDLCTDKGCTIVRIKHVVSAVREHETPAYYEGVVALDGPMRVDRSGACRDLYRRDRWYRVKRSTQPFDPNEWVTLATSTSKPSKAVGVTYGAVLLDTNLSLDAGWIL